MNDQVQEVKDRLDIVEVISTYLTVKKAGVNYKANCPFHSEKTPSFMINPERQSFKCFGCAEGGDVITFVEKMEGLDFFNALKLLAEKAGVELKTKSVKFGDQEFKSDQKTRIFEINEWAKKVYHKILLDHPKAEKAREYLKKRGMSQKTIESFEIGYAPQSWDFLLRFLLSKKYTEKEAIEAGVAIRGDRGKAYDRFRGRIIFPINNIMGTTVAFTSRILEDDGPSTPLGVNKQAKYINSAESSIYTKGKTIYGLDKAKTHIKESDLAILVEGNMDVIACHQAGFKNIVATSGTALTLDQLKILSRYASEMALCFDTDEAGQTAMKRAVRLALANDVTTKIITTAPFKDADEAIKADPKNWEKAVEGAKPSLEYWVDLLVAKSPQMTIADRKKIAREILPVVKNIFSEIEKEHYIKYLSEKISVSEQSLLAALEKAKSDGESQQKQKGVSKPTHENYSSFERLVGLLWAEPKLIGETGLEIASPKNLEPKYLPIFEMIGKKQIEREKIKPELAALYDQLAIIALSNINTEDDESARTELHYLLGRWRSEQKEDLKENFARKIKEAESRGDKEDLKKLLSEFSTLIK